MWKTVIRHEMIRLKISLSKKGKDAPERRKMKLKISAKIKDR